MSERLRISVHDDPSTGVTMQTPVGELYFETTDEAMEFRAAAYPDAEIVPTGLNARRWTRAPELESDYAREIGATVHRVPRRSA